MLNRSRRCYNLAILSSLLVALSTAACGRVEAPGQSPMFGTFLDDDWKYWMTEYPELATSVGYPGQNARWTDYSPGAMDKRAGHLRQSVQRLAALDRASLNADEQVSYDLYRDDLDMAVKGLAFHYDPIPLRGVIPHSLLMPINQLEGVQQDVPRAIAIMPSSNARENEDIVSRIRGVGPLVDQTIAQMEQGLAAGATPPRQMLRDVPDQVQGLISADPFESPLLEAFTRFPASIPDGERADLTERATRAYRESALPAFQKLRGFLASKYLPACRDSVSVTALPDGGSMYAYNIKWHTTTDKTAQQIHEIGLSEVARIRAEMDSVMKSAGFRGSFDDFKTFLRTDPRFYFKDAASLLTAYRDIAKRADPALAHLFGRLPQTPYGVKPVPDAIAPSQTTAYYEQGSLAAGRAANMFANTYKLEARPSWEMEALTMHESVPGHHIQIALAQELQGLPEIRKNSSYTAFVEGWALYAESLGGDMGFYKDPYSKFGQLTYDMWRAVRLVVDTGIHAKGWTRDQAIDFFRTNAAKTDQDIMVEIDRYIVWPGQALGYKMGQLKIRELRTAAQKRLGSRFNVRQFHDVVLGRGAVPLDLLERQVNAWIEETLTPTRR